MILTSVQPLLVAQPADTWAIVRVSTDIGLTGWGEFSGSPYSNAAVAAVIQVLAPQICGKDPLDIPGCLAPLLAWRYPSFLDCRCLKMALSALDMALWDIRAKAEGVPLRRLLSDDPPAGIPLYANLNRLLRRDRSLEALLRAAQGAIQSGLRMVKLAPFDEVNPQLDTPDFSAGIKRCLAVMEVTGGAALSVDCHCRFTEQSFGQLLQLADRVLEAASFVEDPIRIRAPQDMRPVYERWPGFWYATGEDCYAPDKLIHLAECGYFSILNPDLKYIGGISAAAEIFPKLSNKVNLCLHNPSGPIAAAHSAQASVLCGPESVLEYAFGDAEGRGRMGTGGARDVSLFRAAGDRS